MNTQQNNVSLQNIWIAFKRGLKRFWWLLILLAVLGGGVLGVRAWKNYVPTYTASVTFTVRVDNSVYAGISAYNAKTASQMERTFPYILTSGVLSDIVKEDLNTDYLPAISAKAIENANLLELKVTGTDPKFCHKVLQSVINNYPAIAERVVGPTELTIVDATGIPDTPNNQRSWKSAAEKGALAGLAAAALLILAYGSLNATVMGRDDFQRISNAAYLGALPVVPSKKRTNAAAQIVNLKTVNSRNYREAFRTVSSRVNKALKQNNYRVLMVSSAIPSEGKTTVSFNLATALSDLQHKVLLIDCDLRSPSLYRMLKQKECEGITEWYNGEAELSQIIHSVTADKLDVIFAGQATNDSAEILGSDKFKQLLTSLRNEYDLIVLDTPPCSMLADATELSTQADCFAMVVKQDYASRDSVISGLNNLQESGIPIIGYIMNEYEGGASGRYGYGYGYGKYGYGKYGYGKYGYGQKADEAESVEEVVESTAEAVLIKNNADDLDIEKQQEKAAVMDKPVNVSETAFPAEEAEAPETELQEAELQETELQEAEVQEIEVQEAELQETEKPKKQLIDLSARKSLKTDRQSKGKDKVKGRNKNKDKDKDKDKGSSPLIIAAASLVGLALVLVMTVLILTYVGANSMTDDGSGIDASALGAEDYGNGTIRYNGQLYKYNKNISSILFMGVDDYDKEESISKGIDNSSDVNVLAVMDPVNKKLVLISISRDTVCEIEVLDANGNSQGTAEAQLALSYSYGDGAESSCELTTQAVSKIFYDLNIPAYGSMYMNGIVDLVNTVGGVTVTADGKQVNLDGKEARSYIHHRSHDVEGNDERMERQSQVIKALVYKAIASAKANPRSILDIYQTVKNNTTTNLNAAKIVYLAQQAAKLNFDGEIQKVPGHSEMGDQDHAEYIIDEEAFFELILNTFYIPVAG